MNQFKLFMETKRYIDPLNDIAFKKIFGSEPNKDLLIDLLNKVLRGRKKIKDLIYNKNEHHGAGKDEGSISFDLLCTGDKGEQFIVEVQWERHANFKERSLFYTSRLISEQAPKGKVKEWNYALKEVYLIAILEKFTVQDSKQKFLYDICLCDRDTGEIFYDKLGYTYIQLRNFVKQENELESDLDRWLYILKHMSKMDKMPAYMRKPIFKKMFNIAEYSNLTKEERMYYDASLKRDWDNYSALETAKQDGKVEGKIEEKIEIARKMKVKEKPVEEIVEYTGLSAEEIEKL